MDDRPVEGLYGGGDCVTSPAVDAYWRAGQTLGNAHVFGYAAAQHAHNAAAKAVQAAASGRVPDSSDGRNACVGITETGIRVSEHVE